MFSARKSKFSRSFAFYLGLGYLLVYALCTLIIYLLSSAGIAKSARNFDRRDVKAECEELVALLDQNNSGNMLAEAVTMERYPPSTIFILRVINPRGFVEYTVMWPKKIDVPEWKTDRWETKEELPQAGGSEYFLSRYNRYIQVETVIAKDGRILQVGKGSFLEMDQKAMLMKLLLIFAVVSTIFSIISAVFMMMITLRPIHRLTDEMDEIIKTGAFEKGRAPVKSTISELDRLGQMFTVMTEKYANLISAMRETMDHVAHDFRTPLARIRGGAELALGQYDKIPPDVAEELADIIEDCDRVKLQLQNLMDAREMESGFVKLSRDPVELRKLMQDMMDLYEMVAEEKGVQFNSDFPETGVKIVGDRSRLERAVGNLIDNAIKYTPAKGVVSVRLKSENDHVVIQVEDSGIGIPEEEQSLVWHRLFRGKKAQESEKGLGLGLNIVRIIIQAHQGNVTLKSAPGEGTAFTITLPKGEL